MSTVDVMFDWVIPLVGAIVILLAALPAWVMLASGCRCRRRPPWWLVWWPWSHTDRVGLTVDVAVNVLLTLWWLVWGWQGGVIVGGVFTARAVLILVWHEWPRIKRSARKAGRVVVTAAGRLVVRPEAAREAA